MQNDIELLGLAAKAAGIELQWSRVIGQSPRKSSCWSVWNPLIDDGDAFRLAVNLNLSVEILAGSLRHSQGATIVEHDEFMCEVVHEVDKYASTRRAIVMAAAYIGRSME